MRDQTSEPSRELPNEWIGRLFDRFRAMYGNKASIMWGEVDPTILVQTWRTELAGIAPDDIRVALESMKTAYTDFPPTLPQFMALCRDARRNRRSLVALLPDKSRDPDGMRKLEAMGESLAGTKRDPRAWARKVLERHAAGDRSLPPISIQFAREALGMPPE